MHQNPETAFLHKARTAYIESLERLDAHVLARLKAGRTQALASVTSHPPRWRKPAWSLPIGALAALLLVTAIGMLWWNPNTQPAAPFTAAGTDNEDIAIVLGNDNLDMYTDMDFYRWLQSQPQANAPAGDSGGDNSG